MDMTSEGPVKLVCSLCGTGVERDLTDAERDRFGDRLLSEYETDCRICHGLVLAQLRRDDRRNRWLPDGPKYGRTGRLSA